MAGQEERGLPPGSRSTRTSGGIVSPGEGRGASTRSLPRAAGTNFDRVSHTNPPLGAKKRACRLSLGSPLESEPVGSSVTIQRYLGKIRTECAIASWRGQDARRVGAPRRTGNTYRDSLPRGPSTRTAGQTGAAPPEPAPRSRPAAAFQAMGPTPSSSTWGRRLGRGAGAGCAGLVAARCAGDATGALPRAAAPAAEASNPAAPTITIALRSATMMRDVSRPRYRWVVLVELDAAAARAAFLVAGFRAGAGGLSVRSRATQMSSLLPLASIEL